MLCDVLCSVLLRRGKEKKEKEEEEEWRVSSKNKNPTLRMWGKNKKQKKTPPQRFFLRYIYIYTYIDVPGAQNPVTKLNLKVCYNVFANT